MTGPRPSLETRAATVPVRRRKDRPDPRGDAEYAAALAHQTEISLLRSANWRAGRPLEDHERWPRLTSADLSTRQPHNTGRWANG